MIFFKCLFGLDKCSGPVSYTHLENNNAKIGYIVAPKTSPYVFRNCEVTTDGAHGDAAVLGKYGRTWGCLLYTSFQTMLRLERIQPY